MSHNQFMACRFPVVVASLLLSISASQASAGTVTKQLIVGTWECGPTVMKGPDVTVTASYVLERKPDMTFMHTGTSRVEPKGREAFTFDATYRGTWKLAGDVLTWTYTESKFVGSSLPQVTPEIGQKIIDDEHRKQPISSSRVIRVDARSISTIPVKPLYAAAAVASHCKRKMEGAVLPSVVKPAAG
ncbi:hypothetical protein KY495_09280 [Massilia sp. PAMC28688]|uniref:hypothetical protein n=1 Tax=Massilia sp. PAMC28688 TaxID=2861283 RepID=UPI001C63831F|nr:hypothetical protein [Massilia sp. PAMC28688]QYF95319.1 hypothetical protein KY495_09280 [Massilia sp. PAMC28688]